MPEKIAVELGPVQETLLIPLLGRAEETKKGRGIIEDRKAVEIVATLDYDFSKWQGIPSLAGASIRTRMFDDEVAEFLSQHPDGTIVEIGAGLNTRFERLDNGRAHWVEIDLPDTMVLRRQFFSDSERRHMLSASVLESDWYEKVKSYSSPYCFVSEAVIIYLQEADAERALSAMAANFPGAWLIMDTTAKALVENQQKHDAMKKLARDSWFRWGCDDPGKLGDWGLQLKHAHTFMDVSPEIRKKLPLSVRFLLRIFPWLVKRRVRGYYINRFELFQP